jgi:hypothetical protein
MKLYSNGGQRPIHVQVYKYKTICKEPIVSLIQWDIIYKGEMSYLR